MDPGASPRKRRDPQELAGPRSATSACDRADHAEKGRPAPLSFGDGAPASTHLQGQESTPSVPTSSEGPHNNPVSFGAADPAPGTAGPQRHPTYRAVTVLADGTEIIVAPDGTRWSPRCTCSGHTGKHAVTHPARPLPT